MLEDHLPKSRYRQPGERVVQGQRLMQAASDIFLGWAKGVEADRHFYWRQLRDMKGSAQVEAMPPVGLTFYARICGWTLARAHARSGDPVAIAGYLGSGDEFDQRSPTSPDATPTRTNATTRRSPTGSSPERSRPSKGSDERPDALPDRLACPSTGSVDSFPTHGWEKRSSWPMTRTFATRGWQTSRTGRASPLRAYADRMPVLGTKLHLPSPRHRLVQRPRLAERLGADDGDGPRLILVAAPAGFGKTTFLAQWLEAGASGREVAWLALDPGDSDLACS